MKKIIRLFKSRWAHHFCLNISDYLTNNFYWLYSRYLLDILWGEKLITKVNPVNIPAFLNCCKEMWHCDEKEIQRAHQLKIMNNGETVTVNIYTTGKIQIQSSKENPFFKEVKEKIEIIIKTLVLKFSKNIHHLIRRAKTLSEYIDKLDIKEDVNRMATIIICDTSCEILLKVRVELICNKKVISKRDVNLEDRKEIFRFIAKKGYIEVLEKKIEDLRELRNKLVHQGDIPSQDDAIYAKEILNKFLEM